LSKIITLNPPNAGRITRWVSQTIPPLHGEKTAAAISRLASTDNIRIIVAEDGLRFSKQGCSQSMPIDGTRSFAKKLGRAGINELEVERGASQAAVKKDLDWLVAHPFLANQGLVLVNGKNMNDQIKSPNFQDHLNAMIILIEREAISPLEIAQYIFDRVINFKEARKFDSIQGNRIMQTMDYDKEAIKGYKKVLPLCSPEAQAIIARHIKELGANHYNIWFSNADNPFIGKGPYAELSFKTCKLVNDLCLE
jgi:hypothetical protein